MIESIASRAQRLRGGGSRADGRTLALVIEGGAMRGVCSAGGAVALAELGFSDVFDRVYVTSAAVMNAAYFMTDQALLGLSVYFENCRKRAFFNPYRLWRIIDVDYIIDHVVTIEKPLDLDRLRSSPTLLTVATTDVESGEAHYLQANRPGVPLIEACRATMAIPVLYNRIVTVGGRRLIDGGITAPFPIRKAIADGATDVLVMLTRPAEYLDGPPSCWDRSMFNLMSAPGRKRLRQAHDRRHLAARRERAVAMSDDGSSEGANVATICTEGAELSIRRTTMDYPRLLAATESYRGRVASAFGMTLDPLDATTLVGHA